MALSADLKKQREFVSVIHAAEEKFLKKPDNGITADKSLKAPK